MKNFIKIHKGLWLFICLSIVLVACNTDEFLNEAPRDTIFADNLVANKTGFMFALTALNRQVADERSGRVQNGHEAGFVFKLGTDYGISNTGFSYSRGIAWYTTDLNSARPEYRGVFEWLFQTVNTANFIISRAMNPNVNWEGATSQESEANKNYVIAHAKLTWAWAYRHLTYTWGAVPLSTEEITGLTYRNDWIREPVANIREVIEEYLLFAEEHLPNDSNDPTILTKAVARHYLAELYLAMDRPADAEKKALLVCNDPRYKLITARYGVRANQPGVAFMDQFYQGNVLRSQGNTEVLWAFLTAENVTGDPGYTMRRAWVTQYDRAGIPISAAYGGRGAAYQAISAYGFGVYDDPDDDRFSEFAIRKYWVNPSGVTVVAQMSRAQEPTASALNNFRWAHTRKWDGVSADPNNVAGSFNFSDQPYLRVAETYLLLAEAQMKLNNTLGAADWINKLRRRANASEISPGDVTLDFILDERTRELLTEEHRRHTLNRVGKLYERTILHNKGAQNSMKPFHVLMPIPQTVIDANTGAPMEQNTGY